MASRAEANHLQLLARETEPLRGEGPWGRLPLHHLASLVVELEGGVAEEGEAARQLFHVRAEFRGREIMLRRRRPRVLVPVGINDVDISRGVGLHRAILLVIDVGDLPRVLHVLLRLLPRSGTQSMLVQHEGHTRLPSCPLLPPLLIKYRCDVGIATLSALPLSAKTQASPRLPLEVGISLDHGSVAFVSMGPNAAHLHNFQSQLLGGSPVRLADVNAGVQKQVEVLLLKPDFGLDVRGLVFQILHITARDPGVKADCPFPAVRLRPP
mmetsp:Transcript_27461/g.78549  ORF Transcript_27461/g.78549 Transcript_27461/m.78549 type:complete len:268 (+) Transcript_27461:363-1166(+)